MALPTGIIKASEKLNETNDCSVKAVAIATGNKYEIAHDTLKSLGRRERQGVSPTCIAAAFVRLGYKLEPVGTTAKTVTTLERALPQRGIFIAYTRNHIIACRAGKVLDWTEGRRHRITQVYKVTKIKE